MSIFNVWILMWGKKCYEIMHTNVHLIMSWNINYCCAYFCEWFFESLFCGVSARKFIFINLLCLIFRENTQYNNGEIFAYGIKLKDELTLFFWRITEENCTIGIFFCVIFDFFYFFSINELCDFIVFWSKFFISEFWRFFRFFQRFSVEYF